MKELHDHYFKETNAYQNSQGVLNGKITKLSNQPDKLKELMSDKTDKQKELGRCHLKTVLALRGKK